MITGAEYREIKQRIGVLQGNINGAERDEDNYDGMKRAAQTRKQDAEARLELYINHLSGAVEEYEAAHPPEEPEGN